MEFKILGATAVSVGELTTRITNLNALQNIGDRHTTCCRGCDGRRGTHVIRHDHTSQYGITEMHYYYSAVKITRRKKMGALLSDIIMRISDCFFLGNWHRHERAIGSGNAENG